MGYPIARRALRCGDNPGHLLGIAFCPFKMRQHLCRGSLGGLVSSHFLFPKRTWLYSLLVLFRAFVRTVGEGTSRRSSQILGSVWSDNVSRLCFASRLHLCLRFARACWCDCAPRSKTQWGIASSAGAPACRCLYNYRCPRRKPVYYHGPAILYLLQDRLSRSGCRLLAVLG